MFSRKFSKTFRTGVFIRTTASEFTYISHIFHPLLPHLYLKQREWTNLENQIYYCRVCGHVVRHDFVGEVDSQSILTTVNLFLHVQLMHHIHRSFWGAVVTQIVTLRGHWLERGWMDWRKFFWIAKIVASWYFHFLIFYGRSLYP